MGSDAPRQEPGGYRRHDPADDDCCRAKDDRRNFLVLVTSLSSIQTHGSNQTDNVRTRNFIHIHIINYIFTTDVTLAPAGRLDALRGRGDSHYH